MKLSISHLEEIQESGKLTKVVNTILDILLTAVNDWPIPVLSLDDYQKEIYRLLGEEVDRKKIEDYILKIDFSKNAWKAESLSQLIEVYNYYEENKPLKEILEELKEKIEGQ